jgi:hypothetical protein
MALDNATQWKERGEDWMIVLLKSTAVPATVPECQRDQQWWEIFGLYAAANLADESVDFLNAVDEFKRLNSMDKAQEIYDQFVSTSAPRQVNLYSGNLTPLQDVFEVEDAPLGSLDMFDAAYAEIQQLLEQDTYKKYKIVAENVSTELRKEAEEGGEHLAPRTIGLPQQVKLTREMIQDEIVDGINEVALKDLQKGISLNFWQIEDLVVLHAPYLNDESQPYLSWARANSDHAGTITMKEKGGAFGAGSISVRGATDQATFKAAIARISKKKVVFE